MLETGLAIIALNMPSIWGLRSHAPVENFLRSLRGLTSLHSVTSYREQGQYNGSKWGSRARKEFSHIDQDTELIVNPKHGQFSSCSATAPGSSRNGNKSHQYPGTDLETGIAVRKSVDLQESRMEQEHA